MLMPMACAGFVELPLPRLSSIGEPFAAPPKFRSIVGGELVVPFAPARLISICEPPTFKSRVGPFAPPRLMTISGVVPAVVLPVELEVGVDPVVEATDVARRTWWTE